MTETNTTAPEAVDTPDEAELTDTTQAVEVDPDAPEKGAEQPDEVEAEPSNPAATKARKDAAKYRERLRETETERDTMKATLTGQLEALQRQMIDQHATSNGIKPAAFWAAGTTLSDLLNEDGTVNVEAVAGSAASAKELLGVARFAGVADQGAHRKHSQTPEPEWAGIFKQK